MTQSEETHIPLDKICTDDGFASREEENPSIIQRFAQDIREGYNYPSIMCFWDGKDYKLVYGLNLLKAAIEARQDTILVDKHPDPSGQLNNIQKDRIVKKMLSLLDSMGEEEKTNWPWCKIAERCGVDEGTVRNKAKEVGYKAPKIIKRAAKNGSLHLVDTSRLGQSSKLKSKGFNWTAIDDKQFEELVYEIVNAKKPIKIDWRSGPGGKGRDIEARFTITGSLGEFREERYFLEAKHFKKQGVNSGHISDAFTWSQAERPTVLVIAVSSHLTPDCRDIYIPSWKKNHPGIEVVVWERKDIEERILSQKSTKELAIRFKLIPKSMR
ncbi:hypothetical protein [Allocoleopsis franciscana]|uniref:Restriction endonuclease type IV Mrr domain-containing protein n=1 Tax=Allocoleopsis franciscana PCC 7113 TaxID=1173027 RepID=K9WEY4_9CYAN|nr:hypothetical protein [Allocoleopsis franciscana]AFZ18329.1 hypothetical protein Mic7113_2533 [Allocoleopsis franciscana PCC 7113]